MGYRSEVAIRCQDKAFEMFEKAWGESIPDKVIRKGDNDNLIYWDWVKWYSDYPDILDINSVMNKLDEYENDEAIKEQLGYKFLRLGEDDSDVETRSNNWEIELWMIRQIDLSDFN
jgi:hypothetical protein